MRAILYSLLVSKFDVRTENQKIKLSIIASYEKINIETVRNPTVQIVEYWYVESKFRSDLFILGWACLALWGISQAWLSQSRTETIHPFKAFVHLLAFYLSYLLIPLFFFSIYAGWSGYYFLHEAIFVFIVSGVFCYARFIEPHLIQVKTTRYQLHDDKKMLKPVKIALVADLHIGLFSGHERQLNMIVDKLNKAKPDLVVVAGDWTYEPENKLADELAVLKNIHAPVYSVNGNHDEQYPGPPIQQLLRHALEVNDVMDIEGQVVEFNEFRLIGIGDLWAGKSRYAFYATTNTRQTVDHFIA